MSRVEIEHRRCEDMHHYTVRLYDHHPDNYISIFTIDRKPGSFEGELHSLNGPGFFRFIADHVCDIYARTEVKVLYADVLRSNRVMIRRSLSEVLNIKDIGTKEKDGRTFTVIRMSLIDNNCEGMLAKGES